MFRALVVVRGVIGAGVECRRLRSDSGETFSLAGDTGGHADGERVQVVGEIAEISFCMSGRTIAVDRIEPIQEQGVEAADGYQLVGTVESVTVTSFWSLPPRYVLVAVGTVPTGGWTGARLRPIAEEETSDGVYRFVLEAIPPTGPATTMVQTVAATWGPDQLEKAGARLQSIVVHGANGVRRWPEQAVGGSPGMSLLAFDPDSPSPLRQLDGLAEASFKGSRFPASPGITPPDLGSEPTGAGRAVASSHISVSDALKAAAKKLKTPFSADELIRAEVVKITYMEGGFVGFEPTYTVEVVRSR
jgi:hypothetical protein